MSRRLRNEPKRSPAPAAGVHQGMPEGTPDSLGSGKPPGKSHRASKHSTKPRSRRY